jgi:hypothetical protein
MGKMSYKQADWTSLFFPNLSWGLNVPPKNCAPHPFLGNCDETFSIFNYMSASNREAVPSS